MAMSTVRAQFQVGQLIRHRLFGYRGVIFDVDPLFEGDEDWYRTMARSRPPRNAPWYHVLVHDATHTTYVAERNLEADDEPEPVRHPLIDELFSSYAHGGYQTRRRAN
jgi:heat shock protein HspQ